MANRPDLAARNCARRDLSLPYNAHTREYDIWRGMVARCHRPTAKDFTNYGARGIWVCESWRRSFDAFFANMGSRPTPDHSIDRIDNDGPYSPENCVWSTRQAQARNRRSSRIIEFNGQRLNLCEWSTRTGIGRVLIVHRLRAGWSVEDALTLAPSKSLNWQHARRRGSP